MNINIFRSTPGAPSPTPKLSPIERLPAEAREKLERLREKAEVAKTIASIPYRRTKDIAVNRENAKLRREELLHRHRYRTDSPEIVKLDASIASFDAEISKLADKKNLQDADARALGALVGACERYVEETAGKLSSTPPPALPKITKPLADEVESVRAKIEKHRATIRAAINAPITAAMAKERAEARIRALAIEGAPDFVGLTEGGSDIDWPAVDKAPFLVAGVGGAGITEGRTETNFLALIVWGLRDQLVAYAHANIDEIMADDAGALTEEERAATITKATAEMLADERLEEALIAHAEQMAMSIPRRADADPRAVLGVDGPELKEI
jgi:hypothetical protein